MLVIRMQRTGRKGHAMFRMVVQDSRLTPTSGKVVAYLGSYDPHAKTGSVDVEKATLYLKNGAQPSPRAARLLVAEGVKLPTWVKLPADKTRVVRYAEKRRSTAPPAAVETAAPIATDTGDTAAEPIETLTEATVAETVPTADDTAAVTEK